ncbi:MAG: CoB--CoM heterodisulfide reductase iron-sulfur subunit A family protein [Bacteroidales bacterium]|jgi:heterodisulfide reductase subunit A|nr:CoB--CoM heterodisulfide reductase iron-sulfur subunit A family protein [Bacteroidales bacterium]
MEYIAVIGGGIAGMETAAQLKALGLEPVLIERTEALGGHVASWHCLFPDLSPADKLIKDLKSRLEGVEIQLGTEVASLNPLRKGYSLVLSNGKVYPCRAIVFATGFTQFPAERKEEYGYGIYDHVITNHDLEGWFNGNGDSRVPEAPKAIGFVHCVGSRDIKAGNSQCSKVCCITAIKQAIEMKERFPKAEVYCFYMDLRLFGKKYEDFYIRAQRDCNIHFIRGRVSEVAETIDGRVQVKAEDTLSGRPVRVPLDLLVLMAGIVCNPDNKKLSDAVSMPLDDDGFFHSWNNVVDITRSDRPGVFLAGACTGAKTVPEALAEARSAALNVYQYLKGSK